jgi:voltage-gated potassium channel
MWWGIQTVTTVGYGDVVPQDPAGKAIAAVLMIGGLSLFAVVTGAITSAFVAQAQDRLRAGREDPVEARLDEIGARLDAISAELAQLRRRSD